MKIIKLCLFVPILLFWSCSNEATLKDVGNPNGLAIENLSKEDSSSMAGNPLNPYDYAGEMYSELQDLYFDSSEKDTALTAIIAQFNLVAIEHRAFQALSDSTYRFENMYEVAAIVSDPETVLSDAVFRHFQNRKIGSDLTDFLVEFSALCEEACDYPSLYQSIVTFEHRVMSDSTLSSAELKVLLTTTSIVRFSTYKRKKRPKKNTDPEWDLLIFDMVGACSGADVSTQEAISLSAISGIVASK